MSYIMCARKKHLQPFFIIKMLKIKSNLIYHYENKQLTLNRNEFFYFSDRQ